MRGESVVLLSDILLVGLISHIARTQNVTCGRQQDAACFYETISDFPWRASSSKPAPVVECLSAWVENDEYDGSVYNEAEKLNIKWKQKWADIHAVDGYLIESNSPDSGRQLYKLKLNKDKLSNAGNSSEKYISFDFKEIEFFDVGAVFLYSIPLYDEDSKEYSAKIVKDENELQMPKSCDPGEVSSPRGSQSGITHRPRRTDSVKSTHGESTQVVSLRITILACILTSVGTLLLLLTIFIISVTQCKLIDALRAATRARRANDGYMPGKLEMIQKPKSKVFIMTTMEEEECNDTSFKFHKRAALGLAEILSDSNLYEVSCNLWMTKQISENGVGVWAHRMLTSHEIIIALCNKFTVAALRRRLHSDFSSEGLFGEVTDPSVQLLQRFMRELSPDKRRIIACIEEGHHDCLGQFPMPSVEKWESFNLNYQFADFIAATRRDGECLGGSITERMRSNFLRMMMKYKSEYHSGVLNRIKDNDFCVSKYGVMEKKTKCLRSQSGATSNYDRATPETQYDSVFSSRCNSHSTETVSSCGDTGYHENYQKRHWRG